MSFDYKRLVKFEHNIGLKDKKVRMVSGLVLLFFSLFPGSVLLLVAGALLVATSYFGWCPAYSGFNHNSLGQDQVVEDKVDAQS
ncbi:DUF2892 domain-containing protein [Methylomonas paludis]|uniref:DUF2892 domain-containing protein n=1 Tax=Methylomonas paludis TaxID=1173101 RepID=A0A975MLS7_9GAMM|nr:DUF2892 domain-containing protein [Methylomonas paludis]QWF70162.1 DUF2892 domain-containing protein [Methylomonas paludis]